MLFDPSDTIAAIASPPGPGFRGIVRLSGPGAWSAALDGFTADRPGKSARRTGSYRLVGLRPPLPAAVVFGRGPRTYTGQDAAEIHTVGSPPLLQLLLAHVLAQCARLAEPGEFTLRAFLSGRIDLTRAEAVLGVIEARNPSQLDAALRQLAGGLASPVAALRDRLLDVLAHLEANLDFVDEPDVEELGRGQLASELSRGADDLRALADRLVGRDRSEGHPRVVLRGLPNVGKSRLFNALIGRDAALVSPRPGTTRDYLTALLDCQGLTVELVDTAGEDAAQSPIEARAQALRAQQSGAADLFLECRAADGPADDAPLPDRAAVRVLTKTDLLPTDVPVASDIVAVSAADGSGLDALRRAIATILRALADETDLSSHTGARCREGLCLAGDALASASSALSLGGGEELVAFDLRLAVDELGKIVGAVVTDDILERIFRRFCIGK